MKMIQSLFFQLFGRFSWSSPPWIKKTTSFLQSNPRKLRTLLIFFTLIAIGTAFFNHWYHPTDQSKLITEIIPPSITYNDKKLVPSPLTINFGVKTYSWISPRSVAPLEKIGKQVKDGIQIIPNIAGEWHWATDSRLQFNPAEDWPAGQTYQVIFNKNMFAEHIELEAYNHRFSTHPFQINISELQFHQDPINPDTKKILATIDFNFPADQASFEPSCCLSDLSKQPYSLKFNYDQHKRKAYVESEPITLPPKPTYLTLMIKKGVQAATKTCKTENETKEKILLPDLSSVLQIDDLTADIHYNKDNQPEQILKIQTTAGISIKDLQKHINVYLLPKDNPKTQFKEAIKEFSWSNPGEISPEVLSLATKLKLQPLPEEYPNPTTQQFKLHAPSSGHLYIQITKGLTGFGGFYLKNDFATVLKAPEYPKEIRFIPQGSLLVLGSDKKINIQVRGIPEVRFSICRILENQVNHLITQTCGNLQNPQFLHRSFGAEGISEVFNETRQFNIDKSVDLQYASLDLQDYLSKSENLLGLFILKAEAWDSKKNKSKNIEDNRLIFITDMDLVVKDNADDTHDIFVHSITNGIPVPAAEVILIGKNGLPIIQEHTDDEGHVHFPSVEDLKNERTPTVYLVRKGNDTSFIPYQRSDRQLNYSQFNVGGVKSPSKDHLNAFVFTDRDIYRPGECVHCGIIIKNKLIENPEDGLPAKVIITDPRGSIVMDKQIPLPSHGFFSLDYQPSSQALTGIYDIKVQLVKDNKANNLLGFTSVNVKDFLPDQMKMEIAFVSNQEKEKKAAWLKPKKLQAQIQLMNLFGTPASDCKVKSKIIVSPKSFSSELFKGYHFGFANKKLKTFKRNLADTFTDLAGLSELPLKLDNIESTFQLDLIVESFEGGRGRSLTDQKSVFINPSDYLIGYKTDNGSNDFKKDAPASLSFIAIDSQLRTIAIDQLFIQLYEQKKVPILVKKPNGSYHYQTETQEVLIQKTPLHIKEEGFLFPLPVAENGNFTLVVTDTHEHPLSKYYFSVVGKNTNDSLKDSELSLKLDKKEYIPGDTIEIQITAPFKGSGLITIERDKIYAHKWFKTDSNSIESITIPEDLQGNGYINVTFIRACDSNEVYTTPLSYAIVPFNIKPVKQTLKVELKVPEFVRAGENLPIQFSTDKPSKIIVFAVDEGILQVSNFKSPDPLGHFFRKQALKVKTSQIADLILPAYKGEDFSSSTGGDARRKFQEYHQNPFKRKAEKAVVFWSGIIDADNTPETIHYSIPDDFNGKLRIMAVAVASDAVGSTHEYTQAQSYFAIQAHIPPFVAPDDRMILTAEITNCLDELDDKEPIIVRLETTSPFDIIGPAEVKMVIPHNEKSTATFEIKANHQLGEGLIKITATQGDKSSTKNSSVSIRPATVYRAELTHGLSDASTKTIPLVRQLYANFKTVQAKASSNPLILVDGLQKYLLECPFNCTQSLIAKSFGQLAGIPDQKEFEKTLQTLRERQTSNGGFSSFSGINSLDEEDSLYAMEFLIEAKTEGYSIPDDLFSSGRRYLEKYVQRDACSFSQAAKQAWAIYLLTRTGLVTTNYLTNLISYLTENHKETWVKDLTSSYVASTFRLLQNQKEAERLISNYRLHEQATPDDARHFSLLARHFPIHLEKMGEKPLEALIQGIDKDQMNIHSAANTTQALMAYAKITPFTDSSEISVSELINEENGIPNQILIQNPNKLPYFYQIQESGFDLLCPQEPIKRGIEITREYLDENGKSINTVQLGQKIHAKINARTLDALSHPTEHFIIIDLLPAGFEVVPNSINSAYNDFVEIREDRILIYCSLCPSVAHMSYTLQAINKGDYLVPPIFAQNLDDQKFQAQDIARRIKVD